MFTVVVLGHVGLCELNPIPGLRLVQALYGYTAQDSDEMTFKRGAKMRIIRPGEPGLDSSGGVKPPEFTKYLLLNHCDLEHGHIQHHLQSTTFNNFLQPFIFMPF
jgi:hypothetical protein